MRLSISCDACRQSKVKCVHEGESPCRRCLRLSKTGCHLTDSRSSPRRIRSRPAPVPDPSIPSNPSPPTRTPQAESPLSSLSASTLIAACDLYRKRFPVVNFLHYPSLIADLARDVAAVEPVFLAALLSLCARFMTVTTADSNLAPSETYADYARTQLAHRSFESPSLPLAQSLVMISLYEWGSGRPYRAWMYSGMATYMIQSLLKSADDHMEHASNEPHSDANAQIAYEQLVRTYWCCFTQDCELSSGARQHFALSFRQISVPLPMSDSDFNFGRAARRLTPAEIQDTVGGVRLGIEHGLTIVTRGFDIFVRILRFANESRRDRASGAARCTAATWAALKDELDEWRNLQDTTVRYPETSAPAHVALGYGELFAYINLVYFMSILFLYRDRFLASPRHDSFDHGQPETDESIECLFATAQHIGAILSSLESCATPVITPYAGFSVFVAAHINMYGTVSPLRYPGGLERAEQEKKSNFEYLERLCRFWDVGTSWWRTLQEANKFYESARSQQGHGLESHTSNHLTLAGTFDEYGDIRISRPDHSAPTSQGRTTPVEQTTTTTTAAARNRTNSILDHGQEASGGYDLEAEMMQWPFLDENWSVGFATGYENTWPGLG
ncbi:transcription factor domain-containing protein [Aspergillus mulundensis]|uniref:Putative Zn(II)2Cys6 transcription factor n=1 Tax=Aspergillus mulundensis TaxID=1810919 RepID=A0A3D8QJS9_9EURO|nr:putative Zn(II)2Cys6 transcription factor [Aspergillus mulundensis]RDW61694.1 putative Zn(II)2Cys6 transcription factor [Aspergillus mulundensis]